RHAESPAYSQSLEQWNKLSPIVSHIRPDFPEPYGLPVDGLRGKTSIFSHPVYLFLSKFSLQDSRGGSVDTYSKVAHCKLYVTKTPITAADLLNDRVLPFYASQGLPMLRILTDRGTEYCGKVEQHDYQLYLAINDIEHTKTKAMSPQTNGICERFHKTILNEFYQVTFRKKLYGDLDTLQSDLDEWLAHYNNERTHQGKMCNGRTPMETLLDGKRIWAEKNLSQM
ncbi:integrase core domain-containing protein, partial [Escherichia coli]|uniref:integrase core domain-containing protein n=2 Tax=Escherichia coli TaxID=562 RepID=UPI002665767A